jgi:hypothetical protein
VPVCLSAYFISETTERIINYLLDILSNLGEFNFCSYLSTFQGSQMELRLNSQKHTLNKLRIPLKAFT